MKNKYLFSLMLLMALFVPWTVNAQTSLFSEDFEGGSMPAGWTTSGNGSWSIATNVNSTHPNSAGHGTYCAQIKHGTTGDATKLITPEIDLSLVPSAELSFMHAQQSWSGDIDGLKVYYRTSTSGTWTQLVEYTGAYASWTTEESIVLPQLSSTYQIAFEYIDNYGYGLGIDYVNIIQGASCPRPTGLIVSNITSSEAMVSWDKVTTTVGQRCFFQFVCMTHGASPDWSDQMFAIDNGNNSNPPYATFSGLMPLTQYDVYVRQYCGEMGQSGPTDDNYSDAVMVSFTTTAEPEDVGDSWSDDFEGTSLGWGLINGTQTNVWAWGTAINNGGTHSLYISNDSGTNNAYDNSSKSFVYATKLLTFADGKYSFTYDWIANGESNYDYLRAWLAPATAAFTEGQLPNGSTAPNDYTTITPTGWISLDGGGKLNQQTSWQSRNVIQNIAAGNYYLVFMWCNDGSSGNNPPAAVDNVSITKMEAVTTTHVANNITDPTTQMTWEQFASYVNGGEDFAGMTITLDEDISVTTMVGTTSQHFKGTFDGQGHTITINYTSTGIRCGVFNTADNATFMNLRIAGTMTVSHFPSGVLVGYVHYGCHFINCVSTVEITATTNGDIGGLLGEADRNSNPKIYFDGCAFTGDFIGNSNGWGGFVGRNRGVPTWSTSSFSDVYFTNCVFAPTSIPETTDGCATFARSDRYDTESNSHVHMGVNCYYTQALGQVQGKRAYSITGVSPVTVAMNGTPTSYNVSGIEAYATGIVYNGNIIAGNGDQVAINLSYAGGGTIVTYITTNGSLSGTAVTGSDDPYTLTMTNNDAAISVMTGDFIHAIYTKTDWEVFCFYVNNGHSYENETVTLEADIIDDPVTTMCGLEGNPFKGTFNGQGNTLAVTIQNNNEQGVAPFHYISNATIQNLIVTGSVTQTGSNPHASGLVGFTIDGSTNTIQNCLVHTNVTNSASSGNRHIGGIIGHAKAANNTIIGCVYDGTLNSSGDNGYKGGIVGWSNESTLTLTNCFFAGHNSDGGKFHPIGCKSSPTVSGTVTNCYYTVNHTINDDDSHSIVNATTGKGVMVYSITGDNGITVAMDGTAANTYTYSGLSLFNPGITYTNNGTTTVYAASGDQVSLTLDGSSDGYSAMPGTLTGDSNPYTLDMAAGNTLIMAGTIDYITEINTTDDWNRFCRLINEFGYNYSGETVTLTDDITISKMAGISKTISFQGTFDGQGHTLTLSGGDFGTSSSAQSNADCAPFRFVAGATFLNLEVSGDIYSSNQKAAGFIGTAGHGDLTFTNCVSSVNIHASRSNADGTHGGFIGNLQGYNNQEMTATFNGCAFTGSITTTNGTNNVGGFVGWCEWREDNNTSEARGRCHVSFNNCLVAPNASGITSGCKTFSRCRNESNSLTINNSYYLQTIGDAQGQKAYSITGISPVIVAMNGTPTTQYSLSGIDVYASGIVYNNTLYAGNGESVSLTLGGSTEGYQADYGDLTGTENPYTLTMASHNTVISIHVTPVGDPSKIVLNPTASDEMTWEQFASYINSGETYEGKTITLMEDITITSQANQAGSDGNYFSGTFNGNGKTITIDMTATGKHCAPFYGVSNATINNLVVTGSISSAYQGVGGICGVASGNTTFTNCVSDVDITSTCNNTPNDDNGRSTCGGFVGSSGGGDNPTFVGCAFTGSLTASRNGCGGFIGFHASRSGWSGNYNGRSTYTNCFFAPSSINVTASETAVFTCGYSGGQYVNITVTNSYYNEEGAEMNLKQGKRAYSITGISPVIVAMSGTPTAQYSVSGIDGYAIGIVYNGTIYAGNGENVRLTLDGSPSGAYDVTYGTITGTENPFTLAMEAHDTEVLALTCAAPTNPHATDVGPYSAVLTWEGNAENYNVSYIAPIFYESFENGLGDWTVYPGGDAGAVEWYVDDPSQSASLTAHSGDNVVWSFSDLNVHSDDWLVSPQLNLGGTLKYWVMSEYQDAYEVKLSTTGIEIADFTETLKSMAASENTWTEISIDLSEYEGQQGYIAFHHDYTGGFFLMIDDIGIYGWCDPIPVQGHSYALEGLMSHTEYKWKVQADCGEEDGVSKWINGDNFTTDISCYPPTNLIASNITAHSAVVSWDAEEDVTFQYSFPNNYHPNINPETLTFTDIQGNSRTLRNLRAGTEYGFFLRKNCGADGYSEIIPILFSTEVACPAPTNVEVDDITNHTATLTWEGPSDAYLVSYGIIHVDSIGTYTFDNGEIPSDFTNSNTAWTIWESNPHSGSYCIASNNYHVASSNSTISLTATFEEGGTISFQSRVSSESTSYDYGTFLIDGVQKLVEGGTTPNTWASHSYEVSAGEHTFTWNYKKDGSVDKEEDRYFIDDIVLQSTTEEWSTITVNDTTCILTGLDAETYYDVKVTADCGSEGPSVESEVVSFTTLENCPRPRDIEIEDITHYAATVNWTGGIEGATVSYRTADGEWQSITVTETTASLTDLEAGTVYEVKITAACDETLESDITNFTTIDEHVKIFLTQGDWDDAPNWMDEEVSTITDVAVLSANATITGVAEADQITFEGTSTLTIADGGQLKTNADITATMKKNILGYGINYVETDNGYYLMALPTTAPISAADAGLLTNESEYDLYSWDRTATDEEWHNNHDGIDLQNGMGYLYANRNDMEMSFTATLRNSGESVVVTASFDEVEHGGWNLFGNPFPCEAYITTDAEGMTFYRLIGNELVPITGTIAPMEGFFVKATAAGQTFTISREAPRGR